MKLPAPDESLLARRHDIVTALREIVPGEGVISGEREMRPYESDGLTAGRLTEIISSILSLRTTQ